MRIIIVDDEELAVEGLVMLLHKEQSQAELLTFTRSKEALDYLAHNKADIAFLDIEMGELSGLDLAQRCKELCPTTNIIFVTGYSEYSFEAIKLHVSGYLMKPVRAEDLRMELSHLRHPLWQGKARVRIQTFGNFEVFVDDKPLKVARTKCKECLAYLVDRRGAMVSFSQLTSVLWEESRMSSSAQKNTHKIVSDLKKALRQVDAESILNKSHVGIAIDVESVDCDYFSALKGDVEKLNSFMGEYMTNYSWAEFTLGELVEVKRRSV